jgi:DNA-binding MarR family transcriptional regulator
MSSIMQKQVDVVNQSPAGNGDDVLEAVHALMHLFRARQYRALKDGEQELGPMEGKALGFFARHPGATQRDLVQRSGRDKGQVARLIASLRERGLLEASADENDRRSVRLALSPAGLEVQTVLRKQRRQLAALAVRGLSEEERRLLASLLARVKSNLEEGPLAGD